MLLPPPTPEELLTLRHSAFVLIPRGDRFAAIRSRKNRGLEAPGGKADPGETSEETARREVLEEAGLILGPLVPCVTFVVTVPSGERHVTTMFVGCTTSDAQLQSSVEGEVLWATRAELLAEATYKEHWVEFFRIVDALPAFPPPP